MNRVDFYILRADDTESRWQFAGRLASKASRLGHRVLIAVASDDQARALDDFLWAHPEDSFLPHRCLNDQNAPAAPVEITSNDQCGDHNAVLINLCPTIPAAFERFERLAEIVIQTPEVLKNTREHFSFYKARGYSVHHQSL